VAQSAMSEGASSRRRLSTGVKLAYAGPTFALAGMAIPIFVYMNKFYADVVLVPLGYLAVPVRVVSRDRRPKSRQRLVPPGNGPR
jgi:hypothetical protein